MFLAVLILCGVLGLAVGSFLNVVIWRVPNRAAPAPDSGQEPEITAGEPETVTEPRRESVLAPASYCPACRTPLKPYDNIPVVSWLLLRGRCRHCQARISPRYPLVEVANALLWVLVALVYWDRPELPAYLVLAAGLLALSVIDLELKLLPTRIVVPLGLLEVVLLGGAALWSRDGDAALRAILGGAAAYVVIRLIFEVTRGRGIGYGDVRLSFVLGLALGWLGWAYVVGGFMAGFFLGAVVGLLLLALRLVDRRTPIPFGPFLALGTMLFVLAGAPILGWYLGS